MTQITIKCVWDRSVTRKHFSTSTINVDVSKDVTEQVTGVAVEWYVNSLPFDASNTPHALPQHLCYNAFPSSFL